ncbi:DoxX family protein [Fibrisoma montanum]|uniref:DoxX family protein n=1 Tax=Fibrisoma montanum TaxID=2305895 RepID=A0A418M2X9_9BACT|nr:DoxX family protein [Fibrisoma montanum]RIV20036.1 DoxX family protein [Fibrisoma montanum]
MTKTAITGVPSEWKAELSEFGPITVPDAQPTASPSDWRGSEKLLFRFFFIYFIIQAVPLDWTYYRDLFAIDWTNLQYRGIFYLARYQPEFFDGPDTFANWAIVALIAGVGAVIWTYRDQGANHYNQLYYWLRVVVRYRLAVGLLAYGFIKLFPLQAPYPSISNLNTHYGDFTAWKLFSLSLGIVPSYESFLGLVEILGALLLLNRKTAGIGTLIILPFTGNVFVSNLAYEGGEYVYSFYLVVLALFIFAYDAVRLFRLVSLEQPTAPNRFRLVLTKPWQRTARLALKTAFVLFFVGLYGYKTYGGYRQGRYHFPQQPGLAGASGIYNVSEFRVNNNVLPYSRTDSTRWQDVVFEKWATISIKSNRPVRLDRSNTEEMYASDADRTYELAGSQGRHYYSYDVDPARQTLRLRNRNKAHAGETLTLRYSRPTPSQLILSGINEAHDSIHVVLDKVNKKYLVEEAAKAGRRGTLTL